MYIYIYIYILSLCYWTNGVANGVNSSTACSKEIEDALLETRQRLGRFLFMFVYSNIVFVGNVYFRIFHGSSRLFGTSRKSKRKENDWVVHR